MEIKRGEYHTGDGVSRGDWLREHTKKYIYKDFTWGNGKESSQNVAEHYLQTWIVI